MSSLGADLDSRANEVSKPEDKSPDVAPPTNTNNEAGLSNGAGVRPSTPPSTRPPISHALKTPEPPARPQDSKFSAPRTPSFPTKTPPQSASVYLSSPIRRTKHQSWLTAGTMTPGRPSVKHNTGPTSGVAPPSPFRSSRPPGGGTINLGTPQSVASLPLQTLMMTPDQAREITDLDVAKDRLVLAIEQGEQFRKAAQQFRSLANNYAFQHKLVQIERDESEQRYEVETNIQKKEIEKLVVDIMGYSDKSMDTEQIRRRLKRTKQRLKEMEDLVSTKDRQMIELQNIIAQYARLQSMPMASAQAMQMAMQSGTHPAFIPPAVPPQQQHSPSQHLAHPPHPHHHMHTSSEMSMDIPSSQTGSPEKPRPPPLDTNAPSTTNSSPTSSNAEPLSALEVLASQVLSSGIKHTEGNSNGDGSSNGSSSDRQQGQAIPSLPSGAPTGYGTSPYSSPFYAPYSPYAIPPQFTRPAPVSVPQFGSPEKRRRPSSSSTISAISEEDTLEDMNNE